MMKINKIDSTDLSLEHDMFPFSLDYAQFDFNVELWMNVVTTYFFLRNKWRPISIIRLVEAILFGSQINYLDKKI